MKRIKKTTITLGEKSVRIAYHRPVDPISGELAPFVVVSTRGYARIGLNQEVAIRRLLRADPQFLGTEN